MDMNAEERRIKAESSEMVRRIKDPQVRALVRQVIKENNASQNDPPPRLPEPTEDFVLAEKPVSRVVEPYPLEWLWPGRIPLGSLTLLAGDDGVGKSLLALEIAARVTYGSPWPDAPDERQEEGNVLILSAYDPLLGTTMPRLERAQINLDRTYFSDGLDSRLRPAANGLRRRFRLPDDLRRLRRTIEEHNPMRLVVIDPVWAFCGGTGARGRGQEVTDPAVLAALVRMATECEVAIICVTGLRQATRGRAAFQAVADKGLAAAARAAWAVTRHPEQQDKRVFLPMKMNLGPEMKGLNFTIVDGSVRWDEGPTKLTPAAVIAAERPRNDRSGGVQLGVEKWLKSILSPGSQPAREILEQARECGFSKMTLRRAMTALGVTTIKHGYNGATKWRWSLMDETNEAHANARILEN